MSANTTYYFRGYATNSTGTGYSPDSTFTTQANPVNGVCGSANGHTYLYNETGYTPYTQCSAGSTNNATFPNAGQTVSWLCLGTNGGANVSCSASRQSDQQPLNVLVNNISGGTVTSSNGAINCGGACSAQYTIGDTVTLTATPSSSYWQFNGWGGECSSYGKSKTCNLTIDDNNNVTAEFVPRVFNYSEF
jgi:hypothetical protein